MDAASRNSYTSYVNKNLGHRPNQKIFYWAFQQTTLEVVAYLSLSNQNYTAKMRPREVFD